MNVCVHCGMENLPGDDLCRGCMQPLGAEEPQPEGELETHILSDTLDSLGPRPPACVAPSTPIGEVLRRLADDAAGCVVVCEDDRPIGIFSERDAVLRLDHESPARDAPVSDFMTPAPETLEAGDPVAFALQRMAAGDYRHIPLTREGRIDGLVSARDILRYIRANSLGAGD